MRAKELRIGNYVYYKNTVDVAMVEIIHKKHFDCRDKYGTFTPNGRYEPIPITEEWLLRFGFAKNKNTFILNKDSSVTHEKTGSESGFWYSNDESDAHCYRLKKIEFVHQLQNLFFSLCGEELNVKQL